ncbi:MAG: glycosyltransferase family 4 protein, partial [Candidatus Bathyarchaeia archaeon]
MHIVQETPRFPPAIGGVEEHVYRIYLELTRMGHKITVITSNEVDGKTYPLQEETVQGVKVYRFPLFSPKTLREYWIMPAATKILRNVRCDVIHAHGYRCLISCTAIYVARVRNIPTVFTPHGIYPPRSVANAFLKSAFDSTLGRLLLKFSNKVIALSENNLHLLLKLGVSPEKVAIVGNGVDLEEFEKIQEGEGLSNQLDFSGSPIILYVGRIDWNKRIDKVVHAMPLILDEFPSAKFVIVGPDYSNYAKNLLDLAKRLNVENSIIITGRVSREKLRKFYSVADVFMLPSSYEGFGISLLEAMASKIPVIVYPSGGPSDFLRHCSNAWFLKSVEPHEIFTAVCTLLTRHDLRIKLVDSAFELVRKYYTWKAIARRLESIYESVRKENYNGSLSL